MYSTSVEVSGVTMTRHVGRKPKEREKLKNSQGVCIIAVVATTTVSCKLYSSGVECKGECLIYIYDRIR